MPEHPSRVVKNMIGHRKARLRGPIPPSLAVAARMVRRLRAPSETPPTPLNMPQIAECRIA
jgi:hypothetical protein